MAKHLIPSSAGNSKGKNQLARIRPALGIAAAAIALFMTLPAAPATARTLPGATGIQVIGPDEVLRDHTSRLPTGELVFCEPGGALVRFIVDIEDPEILNRGDGAFHPADEAAVYLSLQDLPAQCLQPLQVAIYLLPYPRAGRLSSSADSRAIYLSPGVRDYGSDQVAFLVTHEIGHIFHRHFMPDSSVGLWAEWAALRGVTDASVFNENAAHAFRPHEIFAEDFRVLFGGPAARGSGAIENPELLSPDAVPGLRAFYERLARGRNTAAVTSLTISPNPIRAGQTLTLRLSEADRALPGGPSASLVDVSGRVIADLAFHSTGGAAYAASLDDAGGSGGRLTAGAYWLRVSTRPGSASTVVPIRILR
jgi:hypothetical protein